MFLNQVRIVSSGAVLLGVYALDRRKQTGSKLTENPETILNLAQISVPENVIEFPKLQNVSGRLNLVECSDSESDFPDCGQENLQNLVRDLP